MSWHKIDIWWCLSVLPSVIVVGLLSFMPASVEISPMVGLILMVASFYLGYAIFNDGTVKYRRQCCEEQLDIKSQEEGVDS